MSSPAKVAIVTGADINLGRTMALALLDAGHHVVLTSLSEQGLKSALDTAGEARIRAISVVADLSDPEQCKHVVHAARQSFGRVDIVVNNAALTPETLWPDWLVVGEPKPWELDATLYRRFLEIDAVAPHILMAATVPHMIERGWGRIINVTTSLSTMLKFWPYGSAKAALEAQTAVLAKRLEGTGVTANVLVPGGFTKPAPLHLTDGSVVQPQLHPRIMAAPVCWLASADANGFTGRRVLAARWNAALSPHEAASEASFDAGWAIDEQHALEPAVAAAVS